MSSLPDHLHRAFSSGYTLQRELGTGGMATVYLALDRKHDRNVAIKILRPELSESVGRQRFLREIKTVARLNHPHILPLYDSGEVDGFLYFVMPVMQGQTLRQLLRQERRLSIETAVRFTAEIADALDHAHRHGVVHRDIKPENILLQDGHALVADFGIGTGIAGDTTETMTKTDMLIGTPMYMSPEQASGEPVDGRSDVYSLGCVLFEMLVGEQPFTGATAQAVLAKRLVQTPPDVTTMREATPAGVARAVKKALARTPIDRFQTGAELVTALTSTTDAVSIAPQKSIAVLPFASMSTDPDHEFFADGITEEILNALAQIPGLRVAGRSSAFSFKGKSEDLRSIGAKLNVATILEGTIRRSGNRIRVSAQLSSAQDGYQLWSERFDREIADVFAVQDEIAAAIAGRLRLSLADDAQTRTMRPPTQHMGAYELYLKGRTLLYLRGRSIPLALECFERAVQLDPNYAQAWAGMADGYSTSGYSGFVPGAAVMPKALEAACRALALDPDLAEAHCARAIVGLIWERDYELAEREFQKAIELNPSYAQAKAWYGLFFLHWSSGRDAEGQQMLRSLLADDPLSGYAHSIMAFSEWTSGRAGEAVRFARRGVELAPNSYLAAWALMGALSSGGDFQEAEREAMRALELSGRHVWALAGLAAVYADSDQVDLARQIFAEGEKRATLEYMQPAMLAVAAAAAGDFDKAIALVDRAESERDPVFVFMARQWPTYSALRQDPRFRPIAERLGLPGY